MTGWERGYERLGIAEWVPRAPGESAAVGQGPMGGRDSVVGTGDRLMWGPERHRPRGQCVGTGDPRKGAPACHVSVAGESPGRALPSLGSW